MVARLGLELYYFSCYKQLLSVFLPSCAEDCLPHFPHHSNHVLKVDMDLARNSFFTFSAYGDKAPITTITCNQILLRDFPILFREMLLMNPVYAHAHKIIGIFKSTIYNANVPHTRIFNICYHKYVTFLSFSFRTSCVTKA